MKWLVSAFEPFGGASSNSSLIVLKDLETRDWRGRIEFLPSVPVTFGRGWEYLKANIDASFDGVLALGQAESRSKVSLESVALNWIDARIEDNRGLKPKPGRIASPGPDVHWTNIPWEKFELSDLCERSYSAGTFVCNELMFHLMDWAKTHGKLAGFVHIPALASQQEPSFSAYPRMRDLTAANEVARVLDFLIRL